MTKFQPDGWHTVTPRIIVRDPENLIAFIRQVFGGRGEFRPGRPAEIRIGDSVVMVSDGNGLRDRASALVRDEWGNTWQIATNRRDTSSPKSR